MPQRSAVRFSELVKTSGRPEVLSLWVEPAKDKTFMRLVKKGRILTLIQNPAGPKKDFGFIGFHPQPHAAFLAFPKPLKETDKVRVIGVKYDLLAEPKINKIEKYKPRPLKLRVSKPKVDHPVQENKYQVTILRSAATEVKLQIVAKNSAEAKAAALSQVARKTYTPSRAEITDNAISVEQAK